MCSLLEKLEFLRRSPKNLGLRGRFLAWLLLAPQFYATTRLVESQSEETFLGFL
jgi:hypothetical protein